MADRKYDFLYDPRTYEDIPCQAYCPVHTDVEGYIHLISEGRWAEAHALILETNPFPSVCARVCQHPCETGCNRGKLDKPVSIRSLKYAATEYSGLELEPPFAGAGNLEKVAVIGAGPAGLTAAYDLARLGYRVTVFESEAHPGGMLRYGIPAYRLAREVIDREVGMIEKAGVDIRYNTRVGRDITIEELREGYKAILIAAGAWKPARLNVPGEDLDGVYHGATFMYKVNKGEPPDVAGKKVVVVGGGFTAMDVSRTAIRLGAREVHIVYRRTRDEIPVVPEEIEEAEDEGVVFHYLVSPLEVVGVDGNVTGLKLIKNKLGEPDASGRRRPVPIEGSEFVMECDIVAPAVSQAPDNDVIKNQGLATNKWGTVEVDGENWMTSVPGVFSCGDFVTGTQHAIKVIAEGHAAAVAIDKYLRDGQIEKIEVERQEYELYDSDEPEDKAEQYDLIERQPNDHLDIYRRKTTFTPVDKGVTKEKAILEARRCFQCNYLWTYIPENCIMCANCVDVCPEYCLSITPLTELEHNRWLNEGIGLKEQGITGIVIDRDKCIRCAFCKAVCPSDAITFSCWVKKTEKV